MSQQFPLDVEQFLNQEIEDGRYPDRTSLIVDAIRFMQWERDETIAGIEAGLRDADAGRMRDVADVFADLRRGADLSEQ